jgi:hypothetical protein
MSQEADRLATLPGPNSGDFDPNKFIWDGRNWLTPDHDAFWDGYQWRSGTPANPGPGSATESPLVAAVEWRLVGCVGAPVVVIGGFLGLYAMASLVEPLRSIGINPPITDDLFALILLGVAVWILALAVGLLIEWHLIRRRRRGAVDVTITQSPDLPPNLRPPSTLTLRGVAMPPVAGNRKRIAVIVFVAAVLVVLEVLNILSVGPFSPTTSHVDYLAKPGLDSIQFIKLASRGKTLSGSIVSVQVPYAGASSLNSEETSLSGYVREGYDVELTFSSSFLFYGVGGDATGMDTATGVIDGTHITLHVDQADGGTVDEDFAPSSADAYNVAVGNLKERLSPSASAVAPS